MPSKAKDTGQPTRAELEREWVARDAQARIDPDNAAEHLARIAEIRQLLEGELPGDHDPLTA